MGGDGERPERFEKMGTRGAHERTFFLVIPGGKGVCRKIYFARLPARRFNDMSCYNNNLQLLEGGMP
jgi:hypothetical protein